MIRRGLRHLGEKFSIMAYPTEKSNNVKFVKLRSKELGSNEVIFPPRCLCRINFVRFVCFWLEFPGILPAIPWFGVCLQDR